MRRVERRVRECVIEKFATIKLVDSFITTLERQFKIYDVVDLRVDHNYSFKLKLLREI